MKYRTLGKNDTRVSVLGFGAMRLPTRGSEAEVEQAAASEVIRYAIDCGVNYVDTAYVYHGGNGEAAVAKALEDGYRQKVHLATKLPSWSVASVADCERILGEQLARLKTDHIEFYLLHCLQKTSWPKLRDLGVLGWAERAVADGRIGCLGFSFHDKAEVLYEIIDAYDWAFCQVQYNFVNQDVQAGTKGLQYAASKGLDVVVMEPLFGGSLASPPPPIQRIWDTAAGKHSPADVALRWVWNRPEVALALSGMNTRAQVCQNVASAERSGVGCLSAEEERLLDQVAAEYKRLSPIPCTKCGYCAPCPHGVDIPVNFELYNNAVVFQGNSRVLSKNLYAALPAEQKAAACKECGTCEEKCPQQIAIREKLRLVREQFP
jgi:uncharacterized protein